MHNCGCKRPAAGPEPHAPVPLHGGGFVPNAIEWLKKMVDRLFGTAVFTVNGRKPEGGNVDIEVLVPSKVSAFENDAGYLTEHQDVSGIAAAAEEARETADEAKETADRAYEGLGGLTADGIGALPATPGEYGSHTVAGKTTFSNTVLCANIAVGDGSSANASPKLGAVALGRNCRALGEASMAGGHRSVTTNQAKYGFAFGNRNYAAEAGAIALGYQAWATRTGEFENADSDVAVGVTFKYKYTFVWQGKDDTNPGYYHSHGDGSFNVNPIGGADGFWIGSSALPDVIRTYADVSVKADCVSWTTYEYTEDGRYKYVLDKAPEECTKDDVHVYAADSGIALPVATVTVEPEYSEILITHDDDEEGLPTTAYLAFSDFTAVRHTETDTVRRAEKLTDAGKQDVATDITTDGSTLNEAVKQVAGGGGVPSRVKNDGDTERIDGSGNVYEATFIEGGYYERKYALTGAVDVYSYAGLVSGQYKYETTSGAYLKFNPQNGRVVSANWSVEGGSSYIGKNPTNGDEIPSFVRGDYSYVFHPQASEFPSNPSARLLRGTVDGGFTEEQVTALFANAVTRSTSTALKDRDCAVVTYAAGMTLAFAEASGLRQFEILIKGCAANGSIGVPAKDYRGDAEAFNLEEGDNHISFAEQADGSFMVHRTLANTITIGG